MSDKKAAKKDIRSLVVGLVLLFFGGWALFTGVRSVTDNKIPLLTPNARITAEVVDDSDSRALGLSNRESIGEFEGMLFVFDEVSIENCLWMKDMKIDIDMVWLNSDKQVVTVQSNVSPDTYPQSFCPTEDAKYSLEVGSGRAVEFGLEPGERVSF